MKLNKFIALVGMTGSGKSVIADELIRKGYEFFRFGQITLDIVKERGIPPTEENEKPIREEVRKKHGMGAYAILNIPKIDALLQKGNVVGDGLYSWSEYKILKDKYGTQLTVIAIYAPPKLRYKRLTERMLKKSDTDLRNRPVTKEQAIKRDFAEIENIEKGGPIAMADYTIINTRTVDELLAQLDKTLKEIGE
ncbi:MAG: AAA family ATPase [Nanoarchaeota archaeon]|nr:AAA family ATPase [Nanoarchaeota archaeon]MBU1269870.1 AAA family ATPase [Nanoarchaeota archaeon]MBU1604266.1 AAA family ATPase [Nanoarchaeota archaeon]MBU2443682.1 AAA family ATPase [Nanoarchaeota archaeon]